MSRRQWPKLGWELTSVWPKLTSTCSQILVTDVYSQPNSGHWHYLTTKFRPLTLEIRQLLPPFYTNWVLYSKICPMKFHSPFLPSIVSACVRGTIWTFDRRLKTRVCSNDHQAITNDRINEYINENAKCANLSKIYWRERAAFQRSAFGRSTAGNDVVATIFIFIFFLFFLFFPPSRPFLIEGVLGSKNLFSESCLERPKI